jgi:hypothetical protein
VSSTVTVGGFEVTSNSDSAASMVESLSTSKESSPEPRVTVDGGETVEQAEPETEEATKAAAVLGKKGGEATAAKKAAEAKEASKEAPAATEQDKASKKGNPRHDPTARVAEATREAREAREEAARERQERERLAAEVASLRAGTAARPTPAAEQREERPAVPAAETAKEAPKEEDFDSYQEWLRATVRHEARQENARLQQEQRQTEMQAARHHKINKATETFFGRVNTASEDDPSFMDRTAKFAESLTPSFNVPPGQPIGPRNMIADEIILSEQGPALMRYLADHPDDYQRIATLKSPPQVVREMAKLEARLDAAPTATAPRPSVSSARPPVRPVAGAPPTAEPDVFGEVPFETFVARRRAQGA